MQALISIAATAAFIATIPLANWLVGNFGLYCDVEGRCLVPVGPWLWAPSGTLTVGLSFVLRDIVHERLGADLSMAAVGVGVVLSIMVAPAEQVGASAVAFAASQMTDAAVYGWARTRGCGRAVILSGGAASAVDSAAYLLLTYGDLAFFVPQVVGKFWASLIVGGAMMIMERRKRRREGLDG